MLYIYTINIHNCLTKIHGMKKISIGLLIAWICVVIFSACSEDNIYPEKSLFTTEFTVYESNTDYNAEKSASASFVSIGTEIYIWTIDNSDGSTKYNLVDILVTGEDGKATYMHNRPLFYYSVKKEIDNGTKMSNLIAPLESEYKLANTFQVEGIFSSEEDIQNSSQYNLPHLSEKYIPKIGSVKFKDTNGDNIIDLDDSVSKVAVYNFSDSLTEEVVYIAVEPN